MGEKETSAGGVTAAQAVAAGPYAREQFSQMSPQERSLAGICKGCGGCIVDAWGDCKGCGSGSACTKKDCICQNAASS